MNQQEFQTAVSPILLKWPRGYSGDQVLLIQDEVKMISHADFVRVVRHLLGAMRVAPMVPDFRKAVGDLGIKPVFQVIKTNHVPTHEVAEDFLYCIRENIWADNNSIFLRGPRPSFIIKKDHPAHPLVIEDAEVRHLRIKEVKQHLSQNTYTKFMESKGEGFNGMKRAFSMEGA